MATFTNQAMLTYNGITTASNTVTGELIGALSAAKTSLSDEYACGDRITYIISLINSSASAINDLTVTDDLGAYELGEEQVRPLTYVEGSAAQFVNGVPAAEPAVSAGGDLVFTGINVPAGSNVLLVYEAEVNGSAPLDTGSSITNSVSAQGPAIANPVEASNKIEVSSAPELSIVKAMSPLTVMENGTLTYTFVIENTGNAPAGEDADLVLNDTFSPKLSGITVMLDGTQLVSPADYTYDELSGEFATVPGVITVPAASYSRAADGSVTAVPGRATLTVTGTV